MTIQTRLRFEVLAALRSRTEVRAYRSLSSTTSEEQIRHVTRSATAAYASESDELEDELGWHTPQTKGVWTCTGRPASRWDLPWTALGWTSSLFVRPPWLIVRDIGAHASSLA